jgi:23S rRNA (adenine2503-C2)-methyltransferase
VVEQRQSALIRSPYLAAPEDLATFLEGEPPYRADQLRHWLYRTPVLEAEEMTNLPARLRGEIDLWPFAIEVDQSADGGTTRKWLFRASDGAAIEAVLMGYPKRTTLCISSQAGCAMACTFCATGQFGFERHLDAGEIVAQVMYANAFLGAKPMPGSPGRVTNVVFMGMGEPLANFARVRESLRRLIEVAGISARSITVSTVGVVPGIRRLAEEPWPVSLAVSLHGADDETRSALVPLNDRYPLDEVVAAAEAYFAAKGRRLSIEWTMIDGANDSDDQARKLASVARRLRAHVNLIPLNATPLSTDRPSSSGRIKRFMSILEGEGANVTLRDTRGADIDAACGQLRVRAAVAGSG